MAKYTKYPLYQYDEPATYDNFQYGINSAAANESLLEYEMRDCLNMQYNSATLSKRKGAKLLSNIQCDDELFNIQGVFLFTYKITYIIIAADGKLYQGIYNENSTIKLYRLHITSELPMSSYVYDPMNIFEDLEKYFEERTNVKHDGFLINYAQIENRYYKYNGVTLIGYTLPNGIYAKNADGDILYNDNGVMRTEAELKELYPDVPISDFALQKIPDSAVYHTSSLEAMPYKYKGEFTKLNKADIQINEVVGYNGRKYMLYATRSGNPYFSIRATEPQQRADSNEWKYIGTEITEEIRSKFPNTYEDSYILMRIKQWDTECKTYEEGEYVKRYMHPVTGEFALYEEINSYYIIHFNKTITYEELGNPQLFRCIKTHSTFDETPEDVSQWKSVTEVEELIFQNYKKIQAATLNNKLYITTGTLFIEVELIDNELVAHPVSPYICNNTEISQIGYNYLSPYPEYCRDTVMDSATTAIGAVLTIKQKSGLFLLKPQMSFAAGESPNDYYYKWEKKVHDGSEEKWYTIISFKDSIEAAKAGVSYHEIEVDDADKHLYRCSFAKSFEGELSITKEWKYDEDVKFDEGDFCHVGTTVYRCMSSHECDETNYMHKKFTTEYGGVLEYQIYRFTTLTDPNGYSAITYNDVHRDKNDTKKVFKGTLEEMNELIKTLPEKETLADKSYYTHIYSTRKTGEYIKEPYTLWKALHEEQEIDVCSIDKEGNTKFGTAFDKVIDEVDGSYFGQATTILYVTPNSTDDTYKIIQSCTKIVKDNNKLLLYGDAFNSGAWYKTIIDNPAYISNRGSLSFKTTKNEELIAVVLFNNNIIAFANSENTGGSIHLVTGAGDDYTGTEYYSPYRKSVINNSISCDNANTIQVCENILVFKYFDTLYYISSSELSHETVSVYSCNDKLKDKSTDVDIPWDDNTCFSEVTEDYYALIWREKYIIDNNELVLERPAMRIKMYYKMSYNQANKYYYPWLRDESEYFNATDILYIKGKPIYLYNNVLITFNENVYTDLDKTYECRVHFKGVDMNYPKLYKFISNVIIYYHRSQFSSVDFNLSVKNEAGHTIIDSIDRRASLQDLRALRVGDKIVDGEMRLDPTITDTKVFNPRYKFPCLVADTIISAKNNEDFTISSITYNYISTDSPDTNPYDLYSSIIRPKEIK